jgi:hypothetical protein
MKSRNYFIGIFCLFAAGTLSLTSCQKNSLTPSSSTSLTNQQAIEIQNSQAQDAIADKTEEDVDAKLEELQNNGYSSVLAKSALAAGLTDTVVITVDHPDSVYFPKVVTMTYYSYKDSSNNDVIIKNGVIKVNISLANSNHPRLVTRAFTFTNFSVTTDSTTVIVNGTRTVNRTSDSYKLTGLTWARLSVTDNITAALNYAVVTTGSNDSLKFTRNVSKVRTAISHFRNVNYNASDLAYTLKHIKYVHAPSLDSLSYLGTVTGLNEKGNTYTKSVQDKLIIVNYKGSLVIESGAITYTVGTTESYLITFSEDPNHMHFTLVTVKNNNTGKSKTFDRRLGGKFKKWW